MKYIIKVADITQDGGTAGIMYYIAETEREMERVCNAFADGHPYTTVTCLGPIFPMPKWFNEIVNKHV